MAKNKKHNIWASKKFLNSSYHHSDATILSSVTLDANTEDVYDSVSLKIRDCSQMISISLDMFNERNYKNSMRKLQIIAENIEGLRKGMVKAHTLKAKLKAKINAAKQTRKKTKKVHSSGEGV